jgi:hypothetical protein
LKAPLDLAKTPARDVLDPGGLVKSLVVQSPDGALRIALNASQSARTQSSRYGRRTPALLRRRRASHHQIGEDVEFVARRRAAPLLGPIPGSPPLHFGDPK